MQGNFHTSPNLRDLGDDITPEFQSTNKNCHVLGGGFKNLELAVLALARIMCADIHSQNGTNEDSNTEKVAGCFFGYHFLDVCRHIFISTPTWGNDPN